MDAGQLNCVKHACIFSGLLRKIYVHVNTITDSYHFYLLLRLTTYQPWRSLNLSDPHKRDLFQDPGTLSLAPGEAISFTIFCQINIHVALSGATFFLPPRAKVRLSPSLRKFASFNASALSEPDAQTRQTLKTHHTSQDTRFWLTFQYEQDNSRQSQYMIL